MSTVFETKSTREIAARNGSHNGTAAAAEPKYKPLGLNAQRVIAKRYSIKDENGEPVETWADIVRRVVGHVATVEADPRKRSIFYDEMTSVMLAREFVPNTPCLVNAGKPKGQLAACFVLDVPDSIEGIMEHAQNVAIIHQTGGGTGMTYEFLRPAGSMVNSTRGVASGPVSFMNIVNQTTEVVKQGGVRRGANMGILSVSHPDILRFIHAKNDQTSLTNFNISVTVTDMFMDAVDSGVWFQTEFKDEPWTQSVFDAVTGADYVVYRRADGTTATFADRLAFETADLSECTIEEPPMPGMVYAPDIWNRIIASAHKYAEPGIIFIDEVNRHNHLMSSMGKIYACNPCGEQQLHFAIREHGPPRSDRQRWCDESARHGREHSNRGNRARGGERQIRRRPSQVRTEQAHQRHADRQRDGPSEEDECHRSGAMLGRDEQSDRTRRLRGE